MDVNDIAAKTSAPAGRRWAAIIGVVLAMPVALIVGGFSGVFLSIGALLVIVALWFFILKASFATVGAPSQTTDKLAGGIAITGSIVFAIEFFGGLYLILGTGGMVGDGTSLIGLYLVLAVVATVILIGNMRKWHKTTIDNAFSGLTPTAASGPPVGPQPVYPVAQSGRLADAPQPPSAEGTPPPAENGAPVQNAGQNDTPTEQPPPKERF
jgi:hypothetical protein